MSCCKKKPHREGNVALLSNIESAWPVEAPVRLNRQNMAKSASAFQELPDTTSKNIGHPSAPKPMNPMA